MHAIMILDLILFFPNIVFGSLIISLRRLKLVNDEDQLEEGQKYLTVSVDCLENVLCEARANKARYVKFSLTRPRGSVKES